MALARGTDGGSTGAKKKKPYTPPPLTYGGASTPQNSAVTETPQANPSTVRQPTAGATVNGAVSGALTGATQRQNTSYIDDNGVKKAGVVDVPVNTQPVGYGSAAAQPAAQQPAVSYAAASENPYGYGTGNSVADIPGVGRVGITIDENGKTITTGLPPGTIVYSADGKNSWKITGGEGGNYSGESYGAALDPAAIYAENRAGLAQSSEKAASGASTDVGYLSGLLEKLEATYQNALANADAASAAALAQAKATIQAQIDALNREYAGANKQLYADYMLSKKNLPQQLAAMGYSGGLTESSLLGLDTSYGAALAGNEQSRLAGVNDLQLGVSQAELEAAIALAEQKQGMAGDFYANYASVMQAMQEQENYKAQQQAAAAQLRQENALNQAKLLASMGDYSGYAALYGADYAAALQSAYDAQNAPAGGNGTSYGSVTLEPPAPLYGPGIGEGAWAGLQRKVAQLNNNENGDAAVAALEAARGQMSRAEQQKMDAWLLKAFGGAYYG